MTPPAAAALVYHARGGVRVLLNDFKGAIADYDETLRIDPCYAVAYTPGGTPAITGAIRVAWPIL